MKCIQTECPLYGRPFVPGCGLPGGLAIVGEAPGRDEVRLGRPFVGRAGQVLRETLVQAGFDPDAVWITNACLCHPEGNRTPGALAIRACRSRLLQELREARPSAILLLGNTAVRSLISEETSGVTAIRGGWVWLGELGLWAMPTIHPAATLYDPESFRDFAYDILRLARHRPQRPGPTRLPEVSYTVCRTHKAVIEMIRDLRRRRPRFTSIDIETTGLDPFTDRILCIGIAPSEDSIWVLTPPAFQDPRSARLLKLILEDRRLGWVAVNGQQFDGKFFALDRHLGVSIDLALTFDILLAHYCLDERQYGHDLKTLARLYFQAPNYAIDFGKLDQYTEDEIHRYLALDCYYTLRLAPILQEELEQDGVRRVHDDLLLPASRMLRDVELTGILVDKEHLTKVREQLSQSYYQLAAQLREIAYQHGMADFNPNSPKQVAELLYDRIGLPDPGGRLIVGMVSGGGSVKSRSTEKDVLESFDHPVGKMILEARQKSRLQSTYVDGVLKALGSDNRVRSDFLLFGTVTGRLSSRGPNLQNQPVLLGPLIRDAYIASPGWVLVSADYSQLELRVLAYYSQDDELIEIYRRGEDLHRQVAAECFKVPPEEVTELQRYYAKYIDFGIIYGRQAPSLAAQLGCSVEEAETYIERLFRRFPKAHQWMRRQRYLALEAGEIQTAFGRKRRFPLVLDSNIDEISRQAVNAPIQGTASDICLLAAVRLHRRFGSDSEVRILALVHDEILLEVKEEYLEKVLPQIKAIMEIDPLGSPVPFPVGLSIGQRWGSLRKYSGPKEIK